MPVETKDTHNPNPPPIPPDEVNGYNKSQIVTRFTLAGILFVVSMWLFVEFFSPKLNQRTEELEGTIVALTLSAIFEEKTFTPEPDALTPVAIEIPTPIPPTEETIKVLNFVLLGNDYYAGRDAECETCLLVHSDAFIYINVMLDKNQPRVNMFSLPRELYVHADGVEPDSRINQLYPRGGAEYVRLWVKAILGIELDGVIAVDMDVFESIVNDVGGIDIVAPSTFTDQCGDQAYTYKAGLEYHLDGHSALCYARMRWYNPRGYFARQERHMDILLAIFNKVIGEFKENPTVTALEFVSRYFSDIETDMDTTTLATAIADSALTYYTSVNRGELSMHSLTEDYLELYPRPTSESPFLYHPVEAFVISDWVRCHIDDPACVYP